MTHNSVLSNVLVLPDVAQLLRDIEAINQFQQIVRENMVEGYDYGIVPGATKPILLKPGAEKITKLLGLADHYDILDRQENWVNPFFRYIVKCSLVSVCHGMTISEGFGECNSMEAKYRWREAQRVCPACGETAIIRSKPDYGGGWVCFWKKGGCGARWSVGSPEIEEQIVGRVENEDIYSQVNTILKMAKKRALVDAALSAGRLSEVFTQDLEAIVEATSDSSTDNVPVTLDNSRLASTEEIRRMFVVMREKGFGEQQLKEHIELSYGKYSSRDLTRDEVLEIIEDMDKAEIPIFRESLE